MVGLLTIKTFSVWTQKQGNSSDHIKIMKLAGDGANSAEKLEDAIV
jgi:hypothetical protein